MTDTVGVWVRTHPATVAINIEENTVLILRGSHAEVLGPGGVTVFDTARNRAGVAFRIASGEEQDLSD
jgi:cyanophycinase-like exopeptidase